MSGKKVSSSALITDPPLDLIGDQAGSEEPSILTMSAVVRKEAQMCLLCACCVPVLFSVALFLGSFCRAGQVRFRDFLCKFPQNFTSAQFRRCCRCHVFANDRETHQNKLGLWRQKVANTFTFIISSHCHTVTSSHPHIITPITNHHRHRSPSSPAK